jgi:hypothetical protein
LDTLEGGVEFLGRTVRAFEFLERFVKDLCDVEQADDVAFFVTNRLLRNNNQFRAEWSTQRRGMDALYQVSEVTFDHGL